MDENEEHTTQISQCFVKHSINSKSSNRRSNELEADQLACIRVSEIGSRLLLWRSAQSSSRMKMQFSDAGGSNSAKAT